MDTFDVKCSQRMLAEHYQKTAKVPTTVWSSAFQVDLEQIYTRLSWVKEEQTTAGSSKEELSHYTELFRTKTKGRTVPKRILVQGETGIGKTTFVKRLLVDWSNLQEAKAEEAEEREDAMKKFNDDEVTFSKEDEDVIEGTDDLSTDGGNFEEAKSDELRKDALRKFELVVSVSLKEVSKCQTLRDIMSHSRLFPEEEEKSIDELLSYIRNNQEKVLVVLDGYDEYRTGSEAEEKYGSRSNSPVFKMFHGDILRDCTVLVTTRSSRADEIRGTASVQAEITGFNMSDREDFMRKMLDDQTQVHGLVNFLWKSNMEDLARVPLLTLFFCLLWKEEKEKLMELTESKTKLFRAIMKHILQHSHRKHSASHVSRLNEENYKDILAEVGKVALEGLLKGDLMFEFDQLPEKVRGEESIIVGLLQLSEYGPSLEPMEMVSFIHKSIQEYLAAWYITYRCVPEGNLGGVEQRASTLEDCEALENVFQFTCGLSDEGAMKVFQHLSSVRISDPTLDFSKTIPDVEKETGVPLSDITDRHERFTDFLFDSFREVRSKAELLTCLFDCTGRIVLVTENRPLYKLMPKVKIPTQLAQSCVFLFRFIPFDDREDSVMYQSLKFLNCLQMPLTIPDSSKVLSDEDVFGRLPCFFSSILCFRNGQFQFYITELFLQCDDHVTLFTESSPDSAPSVTASMFSEQSSLKFLSFLRFYNLIGQTVKDLGAVIQNCKHLNRIEAQKSDDSVCDLLEQVPYPSKCSLTIGTSDWCIQPDVGVHLTSAGAVELASLLPRFNNTMTLGLDLSNCCSPAVNTLVTSITHKTLERLVLNRISLTPAAAAALGGSLPEMLSLQVLELTAVDKSTLQAEDMENLFGGFIETLPLYKLTFSGFGVRGCLAPLTKSFRFFPSLKNLKLEKLNLDEHDQCGLLENLRFIPNLTTLSVRAEDQGPVRCYITDSYTGSSFSHRTHGKMNVDGISLTPAVAAALGRSLPEMSSLLELELTGVDGSTVQAEDIEKLFGGLYKMLRLHKLVLGGFSVRGCLTALIKSLCFFPNLRELKIEKINMSEHDQCGLLESLRCISNITNVSVESKRLDHSGFCTAKLTLTSYSFEGRNSKSVNLDGISLIPAAAAALGQSLPEMSSLKTLALTLARDEIILQTVKLDGLFGGFNKTLPLYDLTLCDFSVEGSIAPLTKSFRFFPNLMMLRLGGFSVDEHNLCCLLDGLQYVPNLIELTVWGRPLSCNPHCCTAKVNTVSGFTHRSRKELKLSGMCLTPAAAAALGQLLPEMLALKELTLKGVPGSILQAEDLEALFGGLNKPLPLHGLTFGGFSVRGCLAPLTKRFRFLPSLRVLYLGGFNEEFNMDEHNLCGLLESLTFIPNLKILSVKGKPLSQAHCCTAEENTATPHKTLDHLNLDGLSLTPAVAEALGRLLPEMSSLQVLELIGVDGSVVQANEMEALFGGFNKALPLYKLTFSGFGVRGCLAPLTKSFRFFPNLRELQLEKLRMDEHDQCGLLENLRFLPNLTTLSVRAEDQGPVRCYITDSYTGSSFSHRTHGKMNVDGISLTPAVAAALGRSLPEMSSLLELELTGVDGSTLQAEDIEKLFGGLYKMLRLHKLVLGGFSVRGCLTALIKSLCFFPNLRELKIEKINMNERDQCGLLESLRCISNITNVRVESKRLDHSGFCTAKLTLTSNSFEGRNSKSVNLDGISLIPAAAAALGQSLPEMSSLKTLALTLARDEIILQTVKLDGLFGGFNKTLPLYDLTLCDFSVEGSIAPLTKSFRFFPNLMMLRLGGFSVDEHNLCCLLDGLQYVPNLIELTVWGRPLSCNPHCCTAKVNTVSGFTHRSLKELKLSGMCLTPAAAAALGQLLPEMLALKELTLKGVPGSILQAEDLEALFGGLNKPLPLHGLTFGGFSVRGCLAPLTKRFRFLPSLRVLYLGGFNEEFNMDEHNLCGLLESLTFIPNLKILSVKGKPLSQAHCCTAEENTATPHKTLDHLNLDGLSLTPAVTEALGRLLPGMSSLQVLELIGVDGSVVQANEMEALFGGFNKALPLYKLTFRDFNVGGSLTALINSFRFFPNLRELQLEKLRMDEHDQCGLLENLRFLPNLTTLSVRAEDQGPVRCYTTDSHAASSFSHRTHDKLNVDGISLTPTLAAALGRSLPEMSSLQELEVTGVGRCILEAEDMVALFGGFNKIMPLSKLTFNGFNVAGCLAPLNKTLRFFPNLKELKLTRLKLDEHDQCGLLQNFGFICNLTAMNVRGKQRDSFSFHYFTRELNTTFSLTHERVEKRLDLDGIALTPAVCAVLGQSLSKMSSLNTLEFTGENGSILEAEEMKALFGGLNKTLPLYRLTFSGFSVRGFLAPFTNMLHFFPNLRELNLVKLNMDEHDLCGRQNSHCCSAKVNTTASFTLKFLESLNLYGISLTPTVAAAFGRSLPEMASLLKLSLTGVVGSILQTEEMEALFGKLNKTLPLNELNFSDFNVTGCLAPLTKSLRFFPDLTYLNLEKLNMDEHDLCGLLESFQFIRDLHELNLSFNPLGHAVRSIVPHVSNLRKLRFLRIHQTDHSEEDFNYVRDAIQQALPEIEIYGGTTDFSQCHTM